MPRTIGSTIPDAQNGRRAKLLETSHCGFRPVTRCRGFGYSRSCRQAEVSSSGEKKGAWVFLPSRLSSFFSGSSSGTESSAKSGAAASITDCLPRYLRTNAGRTSLSPARFLSPRGQSSLLPLLYLFMFSPSYPAQVVTFRARMFGLERPAAGRIMPTDRIMRDFSKTKRVVIKIGTNTLAKDGGIDTAYFSGVAAQVKALLDGGPAGRRRHLRRHRHGGRTSSASPASRKR